jgi:uncharacterized coiled-coil protein SlyX
MLAGWHAAEGARLAHLEAMHSQQVAQYVHQLQAMTMQLARLHQDLAAEKAKVDRLTSLLYKVGAQLHDGPELETP